MYWTYEPYFYNAAGVHQQNVGQPDAPVLWYHFCLSGVGSIGRISLPYVIIIFYLLIIICVIFCLEIVYLQDNDGKLLLLKQIDQCLKAVKKQSWYRNCITNACVGLLSGLKVLFTSSGLT